MKSKDKKPSGKESSGSIPAMLIDVRQVAGAAWLIPAGTADAAHKVVPGEVDLTVIRGTTIDFVQFMVAFHHKAPVVNAPQHTFRMDNVIAVAFQVPNLKSISDEKLFDLGKTQAVSSAWPHWVEFFGLMATRMRLGQVSPLPTISVKVAPIATDSSQIPGLGETAHQQKKQKR